ncbi:uncharacterized protein Dwil_GK27869 [Drosophila willistoni]|uniref:Uncharacterized protein n=1 Tax=Drosophila willistoni TaxID=7260 RepID=A0A0Q9WUM3_DROWI|nr:uncharacterized protein Dwil_GK27869 [Drosophila willistoni]
MVYGDGNAKNDILGESFENQEKNGRAPLFPPTRIWVFVCIGTNVASNEGNTSSAAGSGAESAALFSKLRSFSIGSGPNSPQRVVSNLRGFLTHRLSNITPSDTGCSLAYQQLAHLQ